MVWLLLIPFFSIIWTFFVYPQIAKSYRAYFTARGRRDVCDCGEGLALAYCICAASGLVLWMVPFIAGAGSVATFVLWILVLVKFSSLKGEITSDAVPQPISATFCPQCGQAANPGVNFCPQCGRALIAARPDNPAVCADCGAVRPPQERFCRSCGKPFPPTTV
jgi:RNA polymerase subunit RPABC4/transcription elongation factor Spt4